jgi:hypothetical protein
MNDIDLQREQIQSEFNLYFNEDITIFPRAMASLQSDWVEVGDEDDGEDKTIHCISILRSLIENSPALFNIAKKIGINFEQLYKFASGDMIRSNSYTAYFLDTNLDYMFKGDVFGYRSKLLNVLDKNELTSIDGFSLSDIFDLPLSNTALSIIKKKTIDEFDLFSTLIETSVLPIRELSDEYKGKLLGPASLTDIGYILQLSNVDFIKKKGVWDGNPGTYFEAIDIKKLEKAKQTIENEIKKLKIIDPFHYQQQLGLLINENNKMNIVPFGCSTLINISNTENTFPVRNSLIQHYNSGIFNIDTIRLLEDMINSKHSSENDFQEFFIEHPEFLKFFGYKNICSQPVLIGDYAPNRKPDFILEPTSNEYCDILDLKLSYYENGIIKQKSNGIRVRFKDIVNELQTQLIEYSRYFDDKINRDYFNNRYGLKAYKPKLIGVIGRNHYFKNDLQRQELKDQTNGIELWTYDDILNRAKQFIDLFR